MESFYQKLSERLYDENDLSDITWALCETEAKFKFLFLSFFFKEVKDVVSSSNITLIREKSRKRSRPDFYFELGEQEYLIEVKIEDKIDNIRKYKEDFKNPQIGWIANYKKIFPHEIEARTWEGFNYFLERELPKYRFPKKSKELINFYIPYLKEVCSIIKLKKMKIDNSIFHINTLVKKIINNVYADFETKPQNITSDFGNWYSGKTFVINKKKKIRPWFGTYYEEKDMGIGIYFHSAKNWGFSIYNSKNIYKKGGKYFDKPTKEYDEKDGNYCWFELKQKWINKFNRSKPIKQEEILTGFFKEVVINTLKYI